MALQMERRLSGENVFAGFFFSFCGERQRLKDRKGKTAASRDSLCPCMKGAPKFIITPPNFQFAHMYYCIDCLRC